MSCGHKNTQTAETEGRAAAWVGWEAHYKRVRKGKAWASLWEPGLCLQGRELTHAFPLKLGQADTFRGSDCVACLLETVALTQKTGWRFTPWLATPLPSRRKRGTLSSGGWAAVLHMAAPGISQPEGQGGCLGSCEPYYCGPDFFEANAVDIF